MDNCLGAEAPEYCLTTHSRETTQLLSARFLHPSCSIYIHSHTDYGKPSSDHKLERISISIYLYATASSSTFPCNQPLQWWGEQRQKSPLLSQLALDLLSIPLMSAECERVFSNAKTVITDQRACLKEDIIEASVILRQWLNPEPEVDPD